MVSIRILKAHSFHMHRRFRRNIQEDRLDRHSEEDHILWEDQQDRLDRHSEEDHSFWEDKQDRSFQGDRRSQLLKARSDRQQNAGYLLQHGRRVDKVSLHTEAGYGS